MSQSLLPPALGRLMAATATLFAVATPASALAAAEAAPIKLTTLGSMTWGFYDPAVLEKYPAQTAEVRASMDQAINDYNTVASYSDHVGVTFNPGVPTAEAGYGGTGGSIAFGNSRGASTAHHEMSHWMGMQSWVWGGKAKWGDLCAAGWANTTALSRMRLYKGPQEGIGCDNNTGHFWDYGLNYWTEWNAVSKGRNVGIVGAMRADLGLSDGSNPGPRKVRLVNRAAQGVATDASATEGGALVTEASSTSRMQGLEMSFANSFVRFKALASQRYVDGAGSVAAMRATASPGAGQTWEMLPTNDGYFQLRNQASDRCLTNTASGVAIVACEWNPDTPPVAAQWHLADLASNGARATSLTAGQRLSLQPDDYPGYLVRHANYELRMDPIDLAGPAGPRADATFVVRDGLSGRTDVSLEAANFPGYFVAIEGGRAYLRQNDGTAAFAGRATFTPVPGLDGRGISLALAADPNTFLRHANFALGTDGIGSDVSRRVASFVVTPAAADAATVRSAFTLAGGLSAPTLLRGNAPLQASLAISRQPSGAMTTEYAAAAATRATLKSRFGVPVNAVVTQSLAPGKQLAASSAADGTLTLSGDVHLGFSSFSLFGTPMVVPASCRTAGERRLELRSAPGFDLAAGGRLSGTVAFGDLVDCGYLDVAIDPAVATTGAAIELTLQRVAG